MSSRRSARSLDEAVDDVIGRADEAPIALEPALRRAIAAVWMEHAASERAEARSLAHVATIVLDEAGPGDLHWISSRAVSDELRHAAICHRVARAYDPNLGALPRARRFLPFTSALEGRRAAHLFVLAQCCVQETLAAAYLERAHAEAEAPLARAALRALLGDEIDHGRIGYAFAAALARDERFALAGPLRVWLDRCRAMWIDRARALPDVVAPEHGVLAPELIVETIEDAIRRLIVPGLAALDLA